MMIPVMDMIFSFVENTYMARGQECENGQKEMKNVKSSEPDSRKSVANPP